MEVLFVFWLAFIVKYPQWNPFRGITRAWPLSLFFKSKEAADNGPVFEVKQSENKNKKIIEAAEAAPAGKSSQLITFGLAVFFLIILISCFTGVDFQMSFWSNAERMLGVYHILHFFVLYLVVITVMRDWLDWQITLGSLLTAAVFLAINGINGANYSTLGNTLYVSAFMIFAFAVIFILFLHRGGTAEKKNYSFLRWLYFLALPFVILQFHKADNTGAYVGVGAGIAAFVFLLGIVNKKIIIRIISLVVALAMIGGFVFVFTNHDNKIVANNPILSQMNPQKITFQTRLISWRSAVRDFPNHWLLGTGFGNYAIIFDKYFTANFYDYTRAETYFDRAHNNIIDIASTTGILGISAYLLIFAAAGFYLVRALRRRRIGPLEFCLIASLFIAYFVQNLTVFDSFVTYLCLMIILGYVHWLANTEEDRGNARALIASGGPSGFANREIYVLVAAGLVSAFLIYNYAILPFRMLGGVITGQIAFNNGDIKGAVAIYKEALKYNTPIDRDGRSMFLRSIADYGSNIAELDEATAEDIIAFAIGQGEKNIAPNPSDSLKQMELARTYDAGFKAVRDEKKRAEYAALAIEHIDKSIAASPERIPVYLIKSQFLIGQSKVDESIATLEQALALNSKFYEVDCQLGQIYLIKQSELAGDKKASSSAAEIGAKGWGALDACLANNGAELLVVNDIVKEAINHYLGKNDLDKVVALYERLVAIENNNASYWVSLARLYAEKGNTDKAAAAALQAAAIDPKLKADADEFVKQLGNK
jgi:tetratricopeptide (TPR) repeat protein